jgi:hypothetical protein
MWCHDQKATVSLFTAVRTLSLVSAYFPYWFLYIQLLAINLMGVFVRFVMNSLVT